MDPCCVCLETFGSPPKGWMRLFCGHVYHPCCISGLLGDACPLCRNPIRCKTFTVKVTAGTREMTFTPFQDPCYIDGVIHRGRYARSILLDFIGRDDATFMILSEPGLIYSIVATQDTTQAIINYFTLHARATHRLESKVARDVEHLHMDNAWGRMPLMTFFYLST